jgi:hypothetical protein
LAVREVNAIALGARFDYLQIVGAYLMTRPRDPQ